MDRGIYAATSGGVLAARRLDIIANNLANINTVGFKAQRLTAREQSFNDTLASTMQNVSPVASANFAQVPGVVADGVKTDFTPGPVQYTGNPLDAALRNKNEFFVVGTPEGEQLTRAGNFTLDVDGRLVTPDGFPVRSDGGDLVLPPGQASMTNTGTIFVNGEAVGRLRVVSVGNLDALERKEGARFAPTAQAQVETIEASVEPSALEMPNVTAVEAMVEMITAQRGFEAYTKTVQTIDDLNDRAIRGARTA